MLMIFDNAVQDAIPLKQNMVLKVLAKSMVNLLIQKYHIIHSRHAEIGIRDEDGAMIS